MKTAILIGKFGKTTGQIGKLLSPLCQVQFCPDNEKLLEDMIKKTPPELFVAVLHGSAVSPGELLELLGSMSPGTPVIVMGREQDEDELSEKGLISKNGVFFLRRPVDLDELKGLAEKLLAAETGEGKQPVVLLVDDSPLLIYTMQGILSKRYKVIFATSGPKAIELASEDPPDIILLDFEMPVCNGKMTLELLRAKEALAKIPVVFLTGMAEKGHMKEALSLHPQGYLLKTCTEELLFSTIDQVLVGKVMTNLGETASSPMAGQEGR